MRFLLDDVARILASPMPRRQVFKLLGGAASGVILSTLGIRPAAAENPPCPGGTTACGTGGLCCPSGQVCCTPTGTKPFCVPQGKKCCGNTSCGVGQTCCNGVCCATGQDCVKGRCKASNSGTEG